MGKKTKQKKNTKHEVINIDDEPTAKSVEQKPRWRKERYPGELNDFIMSFPVVGSPGKPFQGRSVTGEQRINSISNEVMEPLELNPKTSNKKRLKRLRKMKTVKPGKIAKKKTKEAKSFVASAKKYYSPVAPKHLVDHGYCMKNQIRLRNANKTRPKTRKKTIHSNTVMKCAGKKKDGFFGFTSHRPGRTTRSGAQARYLIKHRR